METVGFADTACQKTSGCHCEPVTDVTGVAHPPQRASSEQPTKSALSESESASPRGAHTRASVCHCEPVRRLVWQSASPLQAGYDAQAPTRLQHLKPSPSAEGEGGPLAVDEVSPLQAGYDAQSHARLHTRSTPLNNRNVQENGFRLAKSRLRRLLAGRPLRRVCHTSLRTGSE